MLCVPSIRIFAFTLCASFMNFCVSIMLPVVLDIPVIATSFVFSVSSFLYASKSRR